MIKGDIVIIRASAGQPGIRRIWDPEPRKPFVCLEEYWARWERHEIPPVCWPVSPAQIYRFDGGLAQELDAAFRASRDGEADAAGRLKELWKRAKPY